MFKHSTNLPIAEHHVNNMDDATIIRHKRINRRHKAQFRRPEAKIPARFPSVLGGRIMPGPRSRSVSFEGKSSDNRRPLPECR